jgi:DNA mismatch repair protein MutS2
LEVEQYLEELRNELKRLKEIEDNLQKKSKEAAVQLDLLEKEALAREKKREEQFKKQIDTLGRDFTRKVDRFLKRTADRFEAARVRAEAQQRESALKEAFLRKMREEKISPEDRKLEKEESYTLGDTVYDRLFRKQGTLIELNRKTAIIDIEGKRVPSNLDRLTKVEAKEIHKKPSEHTEIKIIEDTSRELNLIGRRVEESIGLLDKFLDRAYLSNLEEVRIVHGFGTGVLKKAVAEFLSSHPQVSGIVDEGGATLVTLK